MSRRDGRVVGPELAPTFSVPPVLLDALGPPVRPTGVVLGADADGEPVSIALLRPTPTRVVLLGGLYLALQITLRAVAVGARVVVVSGRPPAWEPLRRATGRSESHPESPDTVVLVRQDPPFSAPAGSADDASGPGSPDAPLLVVHDRGATARGPGMARGPWQTTLVVLPTLVPAVADLADDADLVVLARMPPHEAELAGRLWHLDPTMIEELRTLPDQGVVVLGRNLWRRVDLVTAARETAILGPVRRGD